MENNDYCNKDLCDKFNNNIPVSELGTPLVFGTNRQDIDFLCEYFPFLPQQDITGILVSIEGGDFIEVYVTESSNPYASHAVYHPLAYYKK